MKNVIERLLNLLAFLLTVDRPVTADEIRQTVAGYDQQSDEAFARMFARDKDLLRRLGVPLKLAPTDLWEVEQGYVIPPDEYRLPDPDLSDEERAALWLAAQVVRIGGQPAGAEAILKLGGARTMEGVEPMAADLGADAGLLAEIYEATVERRTVTFSYRGRGRHLAPHGIGHRRGHWYLVGIDGDEQRIFRVDRIEDLEVSASPGEFDRLLDFDMRSALADQPWEAGSDDLVVARVRFDQESAWWARRRLAGTGDMTSNSDGSIEVVLEVTHVDAFIGWVLSFGVHAVVLSPSDLRQRIVRHVEAVG